MDSFKSLGLSGETLAALEKKGFTKPTPVQEKAIPLLLKGEIDIIAQAATGTGKTASFSLPIIELLPHTGKVQAIILTPTRELALQVADEFASLDAKRKLRVLVVYGGAPIHDQIRELRRGMDVIVGTPGRVIDHLKRKTLDLSNVSFAVLDEADEMLNMGFIEDIELILSKTPTHKRMLLFSATIPQGVRTIAKKFMHDVFHITIEKKEKIALTEQHYYEVNSKDKYAALRRIIDIVPDFHGIVFCRTKSDVDIVARNLANDGYSAAALHGDISQGQREKILGQFRIKKLTILVATDVAARGIDVSDLSHVVNYSVPQSPESYVHRIGRTGRAGKKGIAITLVMPSERGKMHFVERIAKVRVEKKELPSVNDVVSAKRTRVLETIKEIITKAKPSAYDNVAQQLLAIDKPLKVVSAVLRYAFNNQLNETGYADVSKVSQHKSEERMARRDQKGRQFGSKKGKFKGDDRKRQSFKKGRPFQRRN